MNLKTFCKIACAFMVMFSLSTTAVYAQDTMQSTITYSASYPITIEEPLIIDYTNNPFNRATETVWSNTYSVYSLKKPIVLTWGIEEDPTIKVKVTNTGTTSIRLVLYQGTSPVLGVNEISSITIPSGTTRTMSFAASKTAPSLSEDMWTSGFTLAFTDPNFSGNKINFNVTATVTK